MTCWLHLSLTLCLCCVASWMRKCLFPHQFFSLSIQIVVNRPSDQVPTETLWLKRHSSSAQTHLADSYTEVQSAHRETVLHRFCHITRVHKQTCAKNLVSAFMFNVLYMKNVFMWCLFCTCLQRQCMTAVDSPLITSGWPACDPRPLHADQTGGVRLIGVTGWH